MMRYALLAASPFPGGAERSTVELAAALAEEGRRPVVFMPAGPLCGILEGKGVPWRPVRAAPPVRPFPGGDFLRFAGSLCAIEGLRRALCGFDAVVASGEGAMLHAVLSGFSGRVFFVVRDAGRGGWMRRTFFRRAELVLPVSRFLEDKVLAQGAPGEKVRLLLNGIDLERFEGLPSREEAREALGIRGGGAVVLWLGQLVRWKGPDVFVRLAERLRGAAEFVMAGGVFFRRDRRFAREVERRAEAAGVRFFRFRPDPLSLFAAADVLAATSLEEPFGRVVVEAMAAGVVPAAFRSGAFPETIVDGESGFLADGEDGLADAVGELARNRKRLDGMKRACRERARVFDVRRTARTLLAYLG